MEAINQLTIKMNRSQKEVLADAVPIFREILGLLEENKANGFTPFQNGMIICDDFFKIYDVCLKINEGELIP